MGAMVLVALWAPHVIGQIDGVVVKVRPATAAEAPDPAHSAETVVAGPDQSPSAIPRLRAILLKLAGLALVAAIGAGIAVWGALKTVAAGSLLRRARNQGHTKKP